MLAAKSVTAIDPGDDVAVGRAHALVVGHGHGLQKFSDASRQISRLGRFHGGIHEAFATPRRMEEKFRRLEPLAKARNHHATALGRRAVLEMRHGARRRPRGNAVAHDHLLTDTGADLEAVQDASLAP